MGKLTEERKFGLTSYNLKVLGLILMSLDHIYYFLRNSMNIPIIFHYLGRLAAPIFIFLTVEGFRHTKNLRKYLTRLYLGFLLMNLGNMLIVRLFPNEYLQVIINNMFGSLFIIVLLLSFIKEIEMAIENKSKKGLIRGSLSIIILLVINFLILIFLDQIIDRHFNLFRIITTVLPVQFMLEGGFYYPIIAVGLYLTRSSKKLQSLIYILACLPNFIGIGSFKELLENPQWMMIISAIPLYFYNGNRGKKTRNFFYVFYPAHIYILYMVAWFLK